jgi:hypothetical protein
MRRPFHASAFVLLFFMAAWAAASVDAGIASRRGRPMVKKKGKSSRPSGTKQFVGESHFWGRMPATLANQMCRRVRDDHRDSFHPELQALAGAPGS